MLLYIINSSVCLFCCLLLVGRSVIIKYCCSVARFQSVDYHRCDVGRSVGIVSLLLFSVVGYYCCFAAMFRSVGYCGSMLLCCSVSVSRLSLLFSVLLCFGWSLYYCCLTAMFRSVGYYCCSAAMFRLVGRVWMLYCLARVS